MLEAMKYRIFLRKATAILMLSIATVLFLLESLFAQGEVVAYAHPVGPRSEQNLNNFPSNSQLDGLDHVIVLLEKMNFIMLQKIN